MNRLLGSFIFSSCALCATVNAAESMSAGEAYVTRFSGVASDATGKPVIDIQGTVGSIFDLREPKQAPQGQHWFDEPQRHPILAKDAGQVFGIAIDDKNPATVYITATSKFGLHRTPDNSDWMAGMWGQGAGPGTVYRLRAENDYQPEIFATIQLDGRNNSGASLGNIAFNAKSNQLFVSDLESGFIFRLDASSGNILDHYDHGIDGRSSFLDKSTESVSSLPVVSFDPNTSAKINSCATEFSKTPTCWNLADSRRQVWGLGVFTDEKEGSTRLYYSVATDLGDKQSTVWSIGLNKDGSFDIKDVQREFSLPKTESAHQLSVSDIAFSPKGEMLVAENGQLQNLGLEVDEPFSIPHDARLFIYLKSPTTAQWDLEGRYNIGGLSKVEGEYTSAAGGVDFGYGYGNDNVIDLARPYDFVWGSGDALCSPLGPCFSLETESFTDIDEVHGIQGMPKVASIKPGESKSADFMLEAYLIDTDINVLPSGIKSEAEAKRNDATKIGDVEIVKRAVNDTYPVHLVQISAFHRKYHSERHDRRLSKPLHSRKWSHARWSSHRKVYSHYRQGSHNTLRSHGKYGSHYRLDSHYRLWSHNRSYSHIKYGSHNRKPSHLKYGSHYRKESHLRKGSHNRRASHLRYGSHKRKASHLKYGSHERRASHLKKGSHNLLRSHLKKGSHNRKDTHAKKGSHSRIKSDLTIHTLKNSHLKKGSHSRKDTHKKKGSHSRIKSDLTIHTLKNSHLKKGSHSRKDTHKKKGSHSRIKSDLTIHTLPSSHLKKGSHSRKDTHKKKGSHSRIKSNLTIHTLKNSHLKKGSHSRKDTHKKKGSHSRIKSNLTIHTLKNSHAKKGSHSRTKSNITIHKVSSSHAKKGSHSRTKSSLTLHKQSISHAKKGSHSRSNSLRKTKVPTTTIKKTINPSTQSIQIKKDEVTR